MFYYFGYGSNMSVRSLEAKGVSPLSSEPAIIDGWSLCFDIPDFFRIEGGTGNVGRADDDTVHGVLHACRDRDLATLDRLEALGISYERIEATAMTYGGRRVRAFVYRGIPGILDADGMPSARYKKILLRGAQHMRLDPGYIERLRTIPVKEPPGYPAFVFPDAPDERFRLEDLKGRPMLVALGGAVFDMTEARPRHAYLQRLLAGKDATLLFLRRMACSDGSETFEDLRDDDLGPAQRQHMNDYLHEFAREYRYVGRIDYAASTQVSPEDLLGAPVRLSRPPRAAGDPSHHGLVPLAPPPPAEDAVPARAALTVAERTNAAAGHDNRGSLSETAGFMPRKPPAAKLSSREHEAWDQVAAELPVLHRDLRLRERLETLPVLSAAAEDLPEGDLMRAAQLLSMLSHAYWYVETRPPEELPAALARPWAQIRERLGRGPAVLSYVDLIVNNWRLVDPKRPDPMRVDNMRLLVPTVDNQEERVFYLTQTEILAHCSPVIGAAVRAQEAAIHDDREALECELGVIISCFQRVLGESLLRINPCTASSTYVDPVVWAKTVAPFAVPFVKGVLGPSGTSSPIFNTLDIFLGRKSYETFLGTEIKALRDIYPPHWRRYLAALHEVDVPGYIRRTEDPNLIGLLHEAVELYAGEDGFLRRHRMKVYGYLELAFKVGRSVTIGGFSGMFQDRTWDRVDDELEASRTERLERYPQRAYEARVVSVGPNDPEAPDGVKHVTLDVTGTGIRYEPGARCGVLPENRDALVERTLASLGATGDEVVPLTKEWRDSVRLRAGYRDSEELTVADVVRFGRVRPVTPRLAEALHAVTQNATLLERMTRRTTEDWELWELLDMIRAEGFDPGQLWEGEHAGRLCRVVPPETFRLYSISSVMGSANSAARREIHLTVNPIRYLPPGGEGEPRYGTASNFLTEAANRDRPISVALFRPPRFQLPRDPRRPIVMIGGGTGIAPFRSFLIERARQHGAGPTCLYLGLRSREYLNLYREELTGPLREGKLELKVAFSRDEAIPRVVEDDKGTRFTYPPGTPQHVDEVLLASARELWEQLRSEREGGRGGYVYVCGRSSFAKTVLDALKEVVRREQTGSAEEREAKARRFIESLLGERRLMTDVFTDARAAEESPGGLNVSELARHNDHDTGWWMAVDGVVYDLTEFVRQHPGGDLVLQGYCGMDASEGYRRAHQGRADIAAMLHMYEAGSLRRLDFGGRTGTVESEGGAQRVSFSALHRLWVKALFLVVEMQNALRADQGLQTSPAVGEDPPGGRSAYKLQRALETHRRFTAAYVGALAAEPLDQLWRLTRGLLAPERGSEEMAVRLGHTLGDKAARTTAAIVDELEVRLPQLTSHGGPESAAQRRLERACRVLEEEDARLLVELKESLCAGGALFETYEAEVADRAASVLTEEAARLPRLFEDYYERLVHRLGELGWAVRPSRLPPPPEVAEGAVDPLREVLLSENLWVMEENADRRYVLLRRTPEEVDSLMELVHQNEKVIDLIRPDHESGFGLVCDFREARGRNDPDFEEAMKRLRHELTTRFPRVAVLLASEQGVLQVNRLQRSEGSRTFATQSETAAIRFAMSQGTASPLPPRPPDGNREPYESVAPNPRPSDPAAA